MFCSLLLLPNLYNLAFRNAYFFRVIDDYI